LQGLPAEANEPAVAQLLGDLYVSIRLNQLAAESYLKALKFAEARQDKLSAVQAQTSLGQIYEALGKKEQAIEYWRLARENLQLLEETEAVQEIDRTLERLQKR
jgi:predicted negative regulator of RcsB-dependent stress response